MTVSAKKWPELGNSLCTPTFTATRTLTLRPPQLKPQHTARVTDTPLQHHARGWAGLHSGTSKWPRRAAQATCVGPVAAQEGVSAATITTVTGSRRYTGRPAGPGPLPQASLPPRTTASYAMKAGCSTGRVVD